MKGLLAASLFALGLGCAGAAHGQQLFKCVSAAGKTSYQEEPCMTTPGKDQPAKPAAASPRGNAPAMKAGWDAREIDAEADACAKPILADGRKYFDTQGKPYPEAQMKPPVDRFCTCVANRIATTHSQADYSKNPGPLRERIANASMKDACKPDGLLAEMWRKTGKTK